MHEATEYLTLSQAAKIAPGRPSANCVWRWCRRGVLARGGERIRLEHIRAGGKILTSPRWVEDFARRLAAADAAYFDQRQLTAPPPPPRVPATQRRRREDAIDRSRRLNSGVTR